MHLVPQRASQYSPPLTPLPTHRFSLHFPESMTYLTPGMVTLVSAMLVARMTFRAPFGAGTNICDCCEDGSEAYSGQVNT
jgi:hypothetical protein